MRRRESRTQMEPSRRGATHARRVVRGPLPHRARRAHRLQALVTVAADSFAQRGGEVVANAPETGMHAESAPEHRRRLAGAAEGHVAEPLPRQRAEVVRLPLERLLAVIDRAFVVL